MEPFFSRYKNALVLIAVLLAQMLGLAMQVHRAQRGASSESSKVVLLRYWATSAAYPFERAFFDVGHAIRGGWSGYVDFRHVRQENQALRAENQRLRLEQVGLAADAQQGQRLQTLLAFKEKYIYKTVAAQVIGTGGSDQSHVLYLDKGSEDGIQADMPVITPDGVVGKVREAFPHSALVLEINDSTSGAGAILEATRVRGVLRGSSASRFPLIYAMPDERIKPGERVVTSGGDQVYPRGLPIGVVQQVKPDPEHDPYVDVVVKPSANLSQLEEVLVVTDTQGQMPAETSQDLSDSEALSAEDKRAASAVAAHLPGLKDPSSATAAGQNASTNAAPAASHPDPALHPDRYTPGATPSADELTPGAAKGPLNQPTAPANPSKRPEGDATQP